MAVVGPGSPVSEAKADVTPAASPREAADTPEDESLGVSLRVQLTLANFVTTGSLLAGLAALYETTRTGVGMPESRVRVVFALIGLAAVLDAVDGPLARYRHTTGMFGGTLDSLADIVSFGVAPVMAAYFSSIHRIPVAGALVCFAFCTCAAWRLARFQVSGHSRWFTGCPVPLAAVVVGVAGALHATGAGMLITLAVLSYLMVGTLPFPTWSVLRSTRGPVKFASRSDSP